MKEFRPKDDPNQQNPHLQSDKSPANDQPKKPHGIHPRQMGRTMSRSMGRSMNRFEGRSASPAPQPSTSKPIDKPIEQEPLSTSAKEDAESAYPGIRWKPSYQEAIEARELANKDKLSSIKEMPAERVIPEIQESVGKGGVNNKADVEIIQYYLQEIGLLTETDVIPQDAEAVLEEAQLPNLIAAIYTFQEEVLHWKKTDGNIGGPESKTLLSLKAATPELVKAQMEEYPVVKANREAQAAAEGKAVAELKEKQQKEVAHLKAKRATEKKEKERVEQLKGESSDAANVAEKLKDLTTNKEIVAFLQDYVFHNPEFVIEAIKNKSGSIFNENTDDLSLALLNKIGKSKLSGIDQKLLKYFYDTLDWGWTDDKELGWMKAIDEVLGGKVENENLPSGSKLEDLMKKERLTPEEIKEARDQINQLEKGKQKKYYLLLQEKVNYKNQRNNASLATAEDLKNNSWMKKYGIKVAGDIMCNLTSVAMALEYLGVSNPIPEMQFEDYLESERLKEGGNYIRGESVTWKMLASKLGVKSKQIDINASDYTTIYDKLQGDLEDGAGIVISVFSYKSKKGHIVRLQEINSDGLLVDDPFGNVSDYLKDRESGKSGYREQGIYDNRNQKKSEVGLGEDNLWKWEDINITTIKYAVVFYVE